MSSVISPSFPASFTYRVGQPSLVTWNLTDQNNVPITGAAVTATLYVDRSLQNPTITPGTVDPIFQNIALNETVPGTSGVYQGTVPATFNPIQSTQNYVTVITAVGGSIGTVTWPIISVVVFPENTIDLVTLDIVKDFLNIADENTDDDGLIQFLITAFSQYVINRTGRTSFNLITSHTDTYDGNGNNRLSLRESPIISLTSVTIGLYQVPMSTSFGVPGVYVEDNKKSIAFRSSAGAFQPPQSIYPYCFTRGTGNIQVIYTAGFASVPFDLAQAAMQSIAANYARKDWIDLASKSMAAGGGVTGSTRYRDWIITPYAEQVIRRYQRRSLT